MKKFNFTAFLAILMFASCTQEFELFENKNVEQEETTPSGVIVDGRLVPYLTFVDWDRLSVGDTVHISEFEFDENMIPTAQTRSTSAIDDGLLQLIDFPINIIIRESNTPARFLTHHGIDREMNLTAFDSDNNIFQTFYLRPLNSSFPGEWQLETVVPIRSGLFNQRVRFERRLVSSVISNGTRLLTIPSQTFTVADIGFGTFVTTEGAFWSIRPSQRVLRDGSGAYIFHNWNMRDGNPFNPTFFCLHSANSTVPGTANLRFGTYTGQGTQEFEIRPVGEFELLDVEIFADNTSSLIQRPDFVVEWYYTNYDLIEREMSTTFQRRAIHTSTFTRRHSVSLNVSASFGTSIPFIEGKVSTGLTTAHEWTFGRTEQVEDIRTYNFPLRVRAMTRVVATLSVTQLEMNLRYRAEFRCRITGRVFTEIGDWRGVDFTTIRVVVRGTDINTGSIQTQEFDGVPTTRVTVSPPERPIISIRPPSDFPPITQLPPDDLPIITLPPGVLEPILIGPPIDTPPIFRPFP